MNKTGFEYVKELFSPILDTEYTDNNDMTRFMSYTGYVTKVYSDLINESFSTETKMSLKLMGLQEDELKKLLINVIISNLYEYITLISQYIEEKGINREAYLYSQGIGIDENNQLRDRFRKRIQPKRLFPDGIPACQRKYKQYYIPNLLKAFTDVIFVPKSNSNIYNISEKYYDIFTALFYEDDTAFQNDNFIRDRDLIKSYVIWEFKKSTIQQIENIYYRILNPPSMSKGDKTVQLLLIEKLFGLINITELLNKDTSYIAFTSCISSLIPFGYSDLHKYIIDRLSNDNYRSYSGMIDEYICPLCEECIGVCLKSVICHLETLDDNAKINKIHEYVSNCNQYLKSNSTALDDINYNVTKALENIENPATRKDLPDDFYIMLYRSILSNINPSMKTERTSEEELEKCIFSKRDIYYFDSNDTEKALLDYGISDIIFNGYYTAQASADFYLDNEDEYDYHKLKKSHIRIQY